MTSHEQIADEALRMRKVRQIVDIASNLIMQARLTRREAEHLVAEVRQRILSLFPDGEETYELVYARRFRRLIDEFAVPGSSPGGVVIPFRRRQN